MLSQDFVLMVSLREPLVNHRLLKDQNPLLTLEFLGIVSDKFCWSTHIPDQIFKGCQDLRMMSHTIHNIQATFLESIQLPTLEPSYRLDQQEKSDHKDNVIHTMQLQWS